MTGGRLVLGAWLSPFKGGGAKMRKVKMRKEMKMRIKMTALSIALASAGCLFAGSAPVVEFAGRSVPVMEARISAMPFNRVWPGHQRDISQSRLSRFVSFDVEGNGGELSIGFADAVPEKARIRPFSRAQPVRRDGKWIVRIDGPEQFVIEFGDTELHVFADPPWTYEPVPNERYFGPGEHDVGTILPRSGETVTIDRDAVVYGNIVLAAVTNVTIRGRGVLCGSRLERIEPAKVGSSDSAGVRECLRRGWTDAAEWGTSPVLAKQCANVRVGGIVFRDAAYWTMNFVECDGVDIDGVKMIGMWRYNSDGIDICASRNISIRNCFLRTFDDCVVARPPCRNMRVENCVLWCDWNWNIKIQHSFAPSVMEDIVFRNIKAVNVDSALAGITTRWGSENSTIRNVRLSNVEADVPPERLRGVFQRSDETRFTELPPASLTLVLLHAYSLGKPADNQGAKSGYQGPPVAVDENWFRILYEDIDCEDFAVYAAPGKRVEDGLGYPITASVRTVAPRHEVRNVRLKGFPSGLRLQKSQKKGSIHDVECVSK